ncbi:MAG: nickel-dependent lactate racemase [Phycisphaerae bacterium]|nr:nickel-dependent lactate racemase [Phycisphaerae bacterium]
MHYGTEGMELRIPADATVLAGRNPPPLADGEAAVTAALSAPIGCPPLREMLTVGAKKPASAAVTISDITRAVPNKQFLPAIMEVLNTAGIEDSRIVIIIGTGMHRPSSDAEREILVGGDVMSRVEVIDHHADDPETLVTISDDPPVRVCRRFMEADFRIVTGFIEPHFMAGFSGGRKGVCPAIVDLRTIRRFHGFGILADPAADTGILQGNPCHEIALKVARKVGVDFLFNVAITRDHQIAGIYCGDLEQAHLAGCEQVAQWAAAGIDPDEPGFDLVITNGGGDPLDRTFYQVVKGMCGALPAMAEHSTLLVVALCDEQVGSKAYTDLMLRYDNDWRRFLVDIEANAHETRMDQWEFQVHTRVLERIGLEKLWFVSDGIPAETQRHIAVAPILGPGNAKARAQRAIDEYLEAQPDARVAIIPEGPYTMLRRG